ncbi:hypothetical protein B5V01_07885 [Mesorhizobium erdmanii]|uniref:Response regulator n=2 Tax=Mesorhizobium TaxID=68287 RepID=A0A3M9X3G6_9HYPH|nr:MULTISPECIES: response regulator [Mesorhizobium]RNJ42453.1 response regulator [Mesorhizobium japonicum]RXT47978.1 hypothetical protein B5V01_07885 [Mesorhizobium erdmanii]
MLSPVVLVVEDEELISWNLEAELVEAGYTVALARSCAEAADFLDTHWPDVAVLDVRLSDGECIDAAKKLYANGVPFIVHSAFPPTDIDVAFRPGTSVSKPGGISDIVAEVTRLTASTKEPF